MPMSLWITRSSLPLVFLSLCGVLSGLGVSAEEAAPTEELTIDPVTAGNPNIPLDELSLLVKPLTANELKAEANAWMELLREKTRQTSQAELAIKQKNKSIEKAEEVQEAIEDTQEALAEVAEASREAESTGDIDAAREAQELAQQARASVDKTVDSIEEALETRSQVSTDSIVKEALTTAEQTRVDALADQADIAREATEDAESAADQAVAAADSGDKKKAVQLSADSAKAATEAGDALENTAEVIDQAIDESTNGGTTSTQEELNQTVRMAEALAKTELEDKKEILQSVTELRTQRTAITDRLNVVLDELSAKLGLTPEGAEHEFILPFRYYAATVNTIKVDVTDTQSAMSNILGWLRSDLGGKRLARNVLYFIASVLAFWCLGWILGRLVDRALRVTRITMELMRSVIVRSVRRVTLVVGIIVGLSAMDINVGPILAIVGAAGFVVAFALQDTLSNFASGIMIMIYRPFDVGDLISVGGVTGEARSMNLVSTTIATRDNQLLVVPNNTIWNNIIVNITGSNTRRVDLIFRIGYDDDIELAQNLMQSALDEHPLVLKDPKATIAVEELGAVSVNFICRPWAKTDDYWDVYREVTRDVKERFAEAGLKPPFLQANVASRVTPWPEATEKPMEFPVS